MSTTKVSIDKNQYRKIHEMSIKIKGLLTIHLFPKKSIITNGDSITAIKLCLNAGVEIVK